MTVSKHHKSRLKKKRVLTRKTCGGIDSFIDWCNRWYEVPDLTELAPYKNIYNLFTLEQGAVTFQTLPKHLIANNIQDVAPRYHEYVKNMVDPSMYYYYCDRDLKYLKKFVIYCEKYKKNFLKKIKNLFNIQDDKYGEKFHTFAELYIHLFSQSEIFVERVKKYNDNDLSCKNAYRTIINIFSDHDLSEDTIVEDTIVRDENLFKKVYQSLTIKEDRIALMFKFFMKNMRELAKKPFPFDD